MPVRDRSLQVLVPMLCLVRRIEEPGFLAENLFRSIAVESLSAFVPAREESLRIEQDDGVVLDTLEKDAETLFALPPQRLARQVLGKVAAQEGNLLLGRIGDELVPASSREKAGKHQHLFAAEDALEHRSKRASNGKWCHLPEDRTDFKRRLLGETVGG